MFIPRKANNKHRHAADKQIYCINWSFKRKNVNTFFILNNIPADFPKQLSGTLVAIDFDKHALSLIDSQGKKNIIVFDQQTYFRAKDTVVSPASIRPGSILLVRGKKLEPSLKANTVYAITNQ